VYRLRSASVNFILRSVSLESNTAGWLRIPKEPAVLT
jgi:hypothetical protein